MLREDKSWKRTLARFSWRKGHSGRQMEDMGQKIVFPAKGWLRGIKQAIGVLRFWVTLQNWKGTNGNNDVKIDWNAKLSNFVLIVWVAGTYQSIWGRRVI